MRRSLIYIIFGMMVMYYPAGAQEFSDMEAITNYLGGEPEDLLDSYEIERLHDLLSKPLRINQVSRSRMISSGLFSNYQVASLCNYISKSGDVLSLSELAAVSGFSRDQVDRIAPFISLESSAFAGYSSKAGREVYNDLSVRTGIRHSQESSLSYGLKYRVDVSDRFIAAMAVSSSYDDSDGIPDAMSGYLSWEFGRFDAHVLVGDFNARFGQGLTLWNGMSLSGLSSVSSFIRHGSGISRSWSYTGSSSLTGLAGSFMSGPVSLSAALVLPRIRKTGLDDCLHELLPVCNVTWYLPHGQIGMTAYADFYGLDTEAPGIPDMKTSVDARFCLAGVDIFAEAAYDWVAGVPAALAGTVFRLNDDSKASAMLRYYPEDYTSSFSAAPRSGTRCSNEYAASIAVESASGDYVTVKGEKGFGASVRRHELVFSADFVYFPESKSDEIPVTGQIKMLMTWQAMLSGSFRMNVRLTERLRNWEEKRARTDLRTDMTFLSSRFVATLRMNVLNCDDWGFLTYMEGGYKADKLKMYLRQGLFFIDDWDDRIYAYERDAPGSFSVPAYYGRGVWTAFTVSWRVGRGVRMYARAALTSYPFMAPEKKKPGKAELKLQCVFDF